MRKKVIARQVMHSLLLRNKTGSSVITKQRVLYDDNTQGSDVKVYDNPQRSFYITKPEYRTYNFKPECELISRLDKYTVYDHELKFKVAQALGMPNGYYSDHEVYKSPYVFGADINIEVLIKHRFLQMYPDFQVIPSVGYLDIETCIETDQIIIISYLYENTVYTAILDSYFFKVDPKTKIQTKATIEELITLSKETLGKKTNYANYNFECKVFTKEIQVIAWIFQCIHNTQPDFVSIWNMGFDIPWIIGRIQFLKYSPVDIFHNPQLPNKYKYLRYAEDKQKKAHFTLLWHWLYSSCASQFIDAMGLYSQLRRTQKFPTKSSLEFTLNKEIGHGKLDLIGGSHYIMQKYHFLEYIVYNKFDVIGLQLLEKKIKDFTSMHITIGSSPVAKLATSTFTCPVSLYADWLDKGMVIASKSNLDNFNKFDKYSPKKGGAVLPPGRISDVGINLHVEY